MDKLSSAMLIGNAVKRVLDRQQAAFNKTNPRLNRSEEAVANLLQSQMESSFEKMIKQAHKKGTSFAGMDQVGLRFWAPNFQCAAMLFHSWMIKEYGLFPHIALSSGMLPIAKDKLWFINIIIRKMNKADLVMPEDKDAQDKSKR